MDIEESANPHDEELIVAAAEVRADYAAGRYTTGTVVEHMVKLKDGC